VRVLTPRLPATLALTALLLSTTGCSPELAPPTATTSSPAAEPLFASDEEALAAAEAAFAEYAAVANTVLQEGGREPQRIRPLVSDEVWESDLADATRWSQEGWVTRGGTRVADSQFQQQFHRADDWTDVVMYNCLSFDDVLVVDADGQSVVSGGRADALLVETVVSFRTQSEWRVHSYRLIEERDSCA
jgi:hypothetical protein